MCPPGLLLRLARGVFARRKTQTHVSYRSSFSLLPCWDAVKTLSPGATKHYRFQLVTREEEISSWLGRVSADVTETQVRGPSHALDH